LYEVLPLYRKLIGRGGSKMTHSDFVKRVKDFDPEVEVLDKYMGANIFIVTQDIRITRIRLVFTAKRMVILDSHQTST
jgi:hypothetical protein